MDRAEAGGQEEEQTKFHGFHTKSKADALGNFLKSIGIYFPQKTSRQFIFVNKSSATRDFLAIGVDLDYFPSSIRGLAGLKQRAPTATPPH
jgi:hypothetical protein